MEAKTQEIRSFYRYQSNHHFICPGLLAPLLAAHDPYETDAQNWLQPPCKEHPFGTDRLGRDIFSRVLYGARVSGCRHTVHAHVCSNWFLLGMAAGFWRSISMASLCVLPTLCLFFLHAAGADPSGNFRAGLMVGDFCHRGTGLPGVARLVQVKYYSCGPKNLSSQPGCWSQSFPYYVISLIAKL